MSHRKKILFITSNLGIGGAENQLILTAWELSRKYEISILCLDPVGSSHMLETRGLDIVCFGNKKNNKRYLKRIISYIQRLSPLIIHTIVFPTDRVGVILAALSLRSIIISHRITSEITSDMRYSLGLTNLADRLTDVIIACSNSVKKATLEWERLSPSRIVTIYNAIDVDTFFRLAKKSYLKNRKDVNGLTIGVVSNLTEGKGQQYFLKAAERILKTHPLTRFLIVGDGSLKCALKKYATRLGVLSRVKFLGHRHDIPNLLGLFDICVFPSTLNEGFPNSVLEYMAAGRPIVATNVGGINEMLRHRKTGILVPPKNGNALAEAILALMKDVCLRDRLGESAHADAKKRFDMKKKVKQLTALYEKLEKVQSRKKIACAE